MKAQFKIDEKLTKEEEEAKLAKINTDSRYAYQEWVPQHSTITKKVSEIFSGSLKDVELI